MAAGETSSVNDDVPRCMSTQHPDNVTAPFFAAGPVVAGDDEIREAFYAFSQLGCDEQMWDFEGKEVDQFVVEKLLSEYDDFFREHPIGDRVFLTPRVPNPRVEPSQAKVLLEVLHSIPRHSDIARLFYGREREPIIEVIFPMTTSAKDPIRVREHYRTHVGGLADDATLRAWFGEFRPRSIDVIPLIEDRDSLLRADDIVAEIARGNGRRQLRVFIARSDPALNYGVIPAVLLSLLALGRLGELAARSGIAIRPIIGVGGPAFRGGLRPDTVDRVLARYPSIETFTIQSAFKYDHPRDAVVRAIARLRSAPRGAPVIVDAARAMEVIDRATARYQSEVRDLAPVIRAISAHVPRRRLRKLHIGLFGYSRQVNGTALPRAIPFCASLYAIGLPPEVLGIAALGADDLRWLFSNVPGLEADLRDAIAYLDPEVVRLVPAARDAVRSALALDLAPPDPAHLEIVREAREALRNGEGRQLSEMVVRAAAMRGFLG